MAARDGVFLPKFREFLDSVGVDYRKDGEIYHNARLAPGRHHYGGWFHFVGTLDKTGDFPPVEFGEGFKARLRGRSAPSLKSLAGLPLVQVEIEAERVPWVLQEKEAD